ncbi:C-type lectin mosGCTL-7-like [Panulirus ornatus]|uniref:C-type lectin mosGCTL-7-like n=1 Tax=Panulirus ornatus TaxID=150431 RepID=UPI003A8982C3
MSLTSLLLLAGAVISVAGQHNQTSRTNVGLTCDPPFYEVGGRCLLIDFDDFSTWEGMRAFCQSLGGDLVKIDSGDLFSAIVRYLHDNARPDFYYWIGATDAGHEGSWVWPDGSAVQMGTPFWANFGCDNDQKPSGSDTENCAILDPYLHLYFVDTTCEYDKGFAICEK